MKMWSEEKRIDICPQRLQESDSKCKDTLDEKMKDHIKKMLERKENFSPDLSIYTFKNKRRKYQPNNN